MDIRETAIQRGLRRPGSGRMSSMIAGIVILFLSCRVATCEETDVPDLIAQLRSGDPAARNAAELQLSRLGDAVLAPCEEAARKEKDAEVRARLDRVCANIPKYKVLQNLQQTWGDRWFSIYVDKVARGWRHLSATPREANGLEIWDVKYEEENTLRDKAITRVKGRLLVTQDDDLTLVASIYRVTIDESESTTSFEQSWDIVKGQIVVSVSEGDNEALHMSAPEHKSMPVPEMALKGGTSELLEPYLAEIQAALGKDRKTRVLMSLLDPTHCTTQTVDLVEVSPHEASGDLRTLVDHSSKEAGTVVVSLTYGTSQLERPGLVLQASSEEQVKAIRKDLEKRK